ARDVFVFDVVRESNGRLARVRGLFSTNLQLAVQHDPLGGEFKIFVCREAKLAVDRQAVQRRGIGIENDINTLVNGDKGAVRRHLFVCPGGWITPASPFDGRRNWLLIRLNNSEYANKNNC